MVTSNIGVLPKLYNFTTLKQCVSAKKKAEEEK